MHDVGDESVSAPRMIDVIQGATRLERVLGDLWDDTNPLGLRAVVEAAGRAESIPGYRARIVAARLGDLLVPEFFGGRFIGLDVMGLTLRTLFRRDPASATLRGYDNFQAWMFVLGSAPLSLQRRAADLLEQGRLIGTVFPGFEAGHPIDREELSVRRTDSGFVLDGSKGRVPGADELAALVAVAATEDLDGAYSLLLLEPPLLPPGEVRIDRSHGPDDHNREDGCGRITFRQATLAPTTLLGEWGDGLSEGLRVLPALQAGLPPMLIGMADTALRVAARAELERLQDEVRSTPSFALGLAFADVLVADALALTAARAVHLQPAACRPLTAASRHLVPVLVRDLMGDLASVIGDEFHGAQEGAVLAKNLKELDVIAFADAALSNSLTVLAAHLPVLATATLDKHDPDVFRLDVSLPDLDLAALGRPLPEDGLDGFLVGVRPLLAELRPVFPSEEDPTGAVDQLIEELDALRDECVEIGQDTPAPLRLALAERYAWILAGTTLVGAWLNRGGCPGVVLDDGWVRIGLQRVLERLTGGQSGVLQAEALGDEVLRRTREGLSLDLVPIRIGGSAE